MNTSLPNAANVGPKKTYKLLGFLTLLYVTFQLVSDVTAGKIVSIWGMPVSITVLYFPVTYILADVLTEVYGYAKARAVLWRVMVCSILAGLTYQLVVYVPPAEGFTNNAAYVTVFSQIPRILIGGWLAVFLGDISNDYVMAKMKVWTNGRWLFTRTIGSTIVGEGINTVVFYCVALYGVIPNGLLVESILSAWFLKTAIETVMTPLTYVVVFALKRVEKEDYYDYKTNFNPLIFGRVN